MRPKRLLPACALALLSAFVFQSAVYATEPVRGVFGLTIAVSGGGILTLTVRSATITQVQQGLPAASAGLAPGDEILEVDGRKVPGAAAKDLEPLAKGKLVGESVALKLKRPDGTSYSVNLVAVAPTK